MEPPRDEWLNRQLRVIGRDLACLSESPRIDGMSVFGARSAVVWAVALAAVPGVQAQVARLTIEQLDHAAWSVRDGAPSYISSLAQSVDGVLWIASALGLYRFDGVRVEQFQPPRSQALPVLPINEIRATPDSSLWIGS